MLTPSEKAAVHQDLIVSMDELSKLSHKKHLDPQERRRLSVLESRISCLKAGFSLEQVDVQELNSAEIENGLPITRFDHAGLSKQKRAVIGCWQELVQRGELRTETTGNPEVVGTFSGKAGAFVPTDFFEDCKFALKTVDPLFNPDLVTYVERKTGRPILVPYLGDTEVNAAVALENTTTDPVDISTPFAYLMQPFTYRSGPKLKLSIEAFQDVAAAGGTIELARKIFTARIARGVGADLMTGNGTNKPLGLIPALIAAGVTPVSAAGSASNDGTAATGANSIGSDDIATLLYAVDASYRSSETFRILMNANTQLALAKVLDKMGHPLVQFEGDEAFIYGYKIEVSPTMANIAPSAYTVVAGDLSYWATLHVTGADRLQLYKEAPGLAENGCVGLQMFSRYGGALLYSDTSSPAPFAVLQQHS